MSVNPVQAARAAAKAARAETNAAAREAFQKAATKAPMDIYPAALARSLGVTPAYVGRWLQGSDMHEARIEQVRQYLTKHA